LAKGGARIEVCEKASELGEVGAGLQQSANAMHIHAALGIAQKITATAFEPRQGAMRHYKTGKAELRTPMKGLHAKRYGQPYLHIHRADLHKILETRARELGVMFRLDMGVDRYSQTDEEITVHCGDKTFSGDILIGADGIHSKVRETMLGQETANFTGQVAWRGTVPISALPHDTIPPDANAWLGPNRHFVSYYLRGGALINFVAVEEREDWAEEDWNIQGDINELRNTFKGWDPRIKTLLNACESCHLWGLFDRAPLPKWHEGRAVLLGDACHPMLPFMAQGSAMAIEDGYVLAQEILDRFKPLEQALTNYEAVRKPRATMLQNISRENAKLFHLKSPIARTIRKGKFMTANFLPALAHTQFDKIYGVNVTQ